MCDTVSAIYDGRLEADSEGYVFTECVTSRVFITENTLSGLVPYQKYRITLAPSDPTPDNRGNYFLVAAWESLNRSDFRQT